MDNYILVNRIPVRCNSIKTWSEFFGDIDNRCVGKTLVNNISVSTVFLGTDYNFLGVGDPILFETMAFNPDGTDIGIQERCSTWKEAEAQHARIVKQVRQEFDQPHIVLPANEKET